MKNIYFSSFFYKRSYCIDQKQQEGPNPTTKARIIIRLHKQSNEGLRLHVHGVKYTIFIE
jgi:hypothetical protein